MISGSFASSFIISDALHPEAKGLQLVDIIKLDPPSGSLFYLWMSKTSIMISGNFASSFYYINKLI